MKKKEVHRIAIGRLKYAKRHHSLDQLSDIFHTFIKEFHEIQRFMTKEELHHHFSKKKASNKDELLHLVHKLEHLKYHVQDAPKEEIKVLADQLIQYLEKIEVPDEKKKSFWEKIFKKKE